MRISDWSSDVCSPGMSRPDILQRLKPYDETLLAWVYGRIERLCAADGMRQVWIYLPPLFPTRGEPEERGRARELAEAAGFEIIDLTGRSEEHTSELKYLMRSSYAVFCLK